jgi:ferredoxin
VVEDVTPLPVGLRDVVVRIAASGICHTDLNVIEGPSALPLPIVPGHEACGVVEEVGPEVRRTRAGPPAGARGFPLVQQARAPTAAARLTPTLATLRTGKIGPGRWPRICASRPVRAVEEQLEVGERPEGVDTRRMRTWRPGSCSARSRWATPCRVYDFTPAEPPQ